MLNIHDKSFYKKFPAFNLIGDINEICRPFFLATGANYFDYNRIYDDNSFLTLSSDGRWLTHFFENKYKIGAAFQQEGAHLWDSYYYQAATHAARVHFNHDHGITIFNKQNNYIEYIDIAAPQSHRDITSLYLNNFDQIENFIADFIERSARLIAIAEKKLVKMPEVLCSPTINSNNFAITDFGFSDREKQCLEFSLAGNTAKETAKILQLSHRTVEEYLNNLKKKTNCRNKRELLKLFNKNL